MIDTQNKTVVSAEEIELNRSIKRAWMNFIGNAKPEKGKVTAAHHAVYAILRGKSLDKTFTSKTYSSRPDEVKEEALEQARNFKVRAWLPFVELLSGIELTDYGYSYSASASHPLFEKFKENLKKETK